MLNYTATSFKNNGLAIDASLTSAWPFGGPIPFAALGFVKYNGMTAEKAIYAWIKSEFLMPKKLVFHSTNVYYELMKPSIEQKQKDHFRESKT